MLPWKISDLAIASAIGAGVALTSASDGKNAPLGADAGESYVTNSIANTAPSPTMPMATMKAPGARGVTASFAKGLRMRGAEAMVPYEGVGGSNRSRGRAGPGIERWAGG